MARTADWRIDLMKAHPRLFEIMPDEPGRSFGYPLCEAGWRDVLVRLCTRIENALQYNETFQFVRIKHDYSVSVTEGLNPVTNTPPWSQRGHVFQHDRRTSVWALIAKVAIWAAEEAGKTRR